MLKHSDQIRKVSSCEDLDSFEDRVLNAIKKEIEKPKIKNEEIKKLQTEIIKANIKIRERYPEFLDNNMIDIINKTMQIEIENELTKIERDKDVTIKLSRVFNKTPHN